MKGLLIKDYRLMLGQKKFMGIMIFTMVMLMLSGTDRNFIITYMMIMTAFFANSTISYDQYENGMSFLMTLPITAASYVREKYLFALINTTLVMGIIVLIGSIVDSVNHQNEMMSLFIIAGISFGAVTFMLAMLLPCSIIFGPEKGRLIMLAIWGIGFAVIFMLSKMGLSVSTETDLALETLFIDKAVYLVGGCMAVGICVMAVSYLITVFFMQKKEY